MKEFYVSVLGAKDYWYRYEWQHRGSPHVHGVAWLSDAPSLNELHSDDPTVATSAKEKIISYVDLLVITMNPAIDADGSNAGQLNCHIVALLQLNFHSVGLLQLNYHSVAHL